MSKSTKVSTATDVRAWALAQDSFTSGGVTIDRTAVPALNQDASKVRGRLPRIVLDAFNAAHKSAPYAAKARPQVEVKVPTRTPSGRKGSRLVRASVPDLRAAAQAAGVEVKAKGKMTEAQMQAGGAHILGVTLAD